MSRIPPIDPTVVSGKPAEQLAAVERQLGVLPNLFKVVARAPAVLDGLVGLTGALARTSLPAATREAVALAVAEANGCDYCLSAHTVLGRGAGLSETAIEDARAGRADDPRLGAIVGLARVITEQRGLIDDATLAAARASGLDDRAVLEIVGLVALNILTNYANLVAQTPIDFPVVTARAA